MTDKKYPIGGYAPGSYRCQCRDCGGMFVGDKNAVQCEPCAIKRENEKTPMQQLLDYIGNKELKPLADVIRKEFIPKEQEFAGKVFDAGVDFQIELTGRDGYLTMNNPDKQQLLDKYYNK